MMRKKIILTVMLILPISVGAQEEKFDWSRVIDAIAKVESKGNPKAHNPVGDCAGILQITPGLVKQCNTWLKVKKSKKRYTLRDRYNVSKSKDGGPGYSVSKTNGYLKKVMKYYKKEAD